MIDWHSHILPGMDDGSHDVPESLALIEAQARQGVDTVIATPHFNANAETVSSFVQRRADSYAQLKEKLPGSSPQIRLGAEVRYYPGISRMDGLQELGIQGSKLLLLEMPVAVWTDFVVKELIDLSQNGELTVILAHIERYIDLQKPREWERVANSDVIMQANATFFTSFLTKRKAISLLQKSEIQLIGSDCHNMRSRPPMIGKAMETIRNKLGENFTYQMNEYGYSLLS